MTGDVALIQDADLEYDPADIPRVLQPILDGQADVVFGSRFLSERLSPRPLLLAQPGQRRADRLCQHPLRPQPDRHGDRLQGGPRRHPPPDAAPLARASRFEPELTDPAGAVGHPALRGPGQLRRAGPTSRGRRSAGATASAPSGRCSAAGSSTTGSRPTTAITSWSPSATHWRSTAGCIARSPRTSADRSWRPAAGSAT